MDVHFIVQFPPKADSKHLHSSKGSLEDQCEGHNTQAGAHWQRGDSSCYSL